MHFWKKALVGVVAAGLAMAAGAAFASSNDNAATEAQVPQQAPSTLVKSGYAQVNGLSMYYEVHGQGQPLVLLHGSFGTIDGMFSTMIPAFARDRQVIAFEMQGHGHTADMDRPMRYETMADDVYAALQQIGVKQADFLGYSMGGGISLQMAIRHPEAVRKLVIVSAAASRNGWYPEIRVAFDGMSSAIAPMMMASPMYDAYKAVAPNPDAFPALLDRVGDFTRVDYDWTREVAGIRAPALIVAGDADGVQLDHVVQMFASLGGTNVDHAQFGKPASQLLIIPSADHITVMLEHGAEITDAASKFLAVPVQ
jgi:pimeloyl-ACP methyl ester carboxylesterase